MVSTLFVVLSISLAVDMKCHVHRAHKYYTRELGDANDDAFISSADKKELPGIYLDSSSRIRPPPRRYAGDGMELEPIVKPLLTKELLASIHPPGYVREDKSSATGATDTVIGYQQSLREQHNRVMMKTAKMHTVGHQLRGAHAAGHFSKGIPILKSMPKQNTGKSDKFSSFRPAAAVVKGTPGDTSSNEILPANLLSNMTTASWCRYHKRMFGVVPEVAWGNLTLRDQAKWIEYDCNELFATKRVSKPIAACPTENYNDTVTTNPKLPLIAIMAATTTRNIYEPSVKVLSLFQLLFASLRLSLDCGFQYMFVLGYDVGDKFYDSKAGLSKTKTWFDDNVAVPLKEKNIFIKLRTVRVDNKLRKPGPVFLEIARFAYDKGAQFLYRVNDDTEFRGRWPRLYANALLSLGPPYGAVGPHSIGSNNRILTHDFVHRMHMEVFDMKYYPVELPDWWMDDWITHVYGPLRTFHSKKVGVYHHTNVHGQRYKVDQSNSKSLLKLIKKGRLTIRHWMIKNKISQLSVIEFEHSMKAPILLGKRDLVALKLRDIPPLK